MPGFNVNVMFTGFVRWQAGKFNRDIEKSANGVGDPQT
jgi:hypothetical protein